MFDTFIKIDGIDGESTDEKHENWVGVLSFMHDMKQPASQVVGFTTGGATGRVDMGDFMFTKLLDKASPKLYEACCKGTHIASTVVEMCRAGGNKLPYMKVELSDVVVSRVSPSGNGQDKSAELPTETVSLSFGKIAWTYSQQNNTTGQAVGQVQTNWSLQKGASA